MTNTFGKNYKIEIYGASHSKKIGVKISNFPQGIEIDPHSLSKMLHRRKYGDYPDLQIFTTQRKEDDIPLFVNGIKEMKTTGEDIIVEFENNNIKSTDYNQFIDIPRPGHADLVNKVKYRGSKEFLNGGGISSGRMTLPLVVAGYFAKLHIEKILGTGGFEIKANLKSIHGIRNKKRFLDILKNAQQQGDSVGGIVECKIVGLPIGIGEPFFDSLESIISHLAFSIPGVKGIEFGNGFNGTKLYGSENNDLYISSTGKTKTNNCGGINGGISNGNDIIYRIAVRPPASISKLQKGLNFAKEEETSLIIKGRHDICFAIRIPIILESISAIAIAELITQSTN